MQNIYFGEKKVSLILCIIAGIETYNPFEEDRMKEKLQNFEYIILCFPLLSLGDS